MLADLQLSAGLTEQQLAGLMARYAETVGGKQDFYYRKFVADVEAEGERMQQAMIA